MVSVSSRRRFLGRVAAVMLVPAAGRAAETLPASVSDLVRKLTHGAVLTPGRVTLELPLIAENGHSVPLTVSVDSPMTDGDHVKKIALISEKNPRPLMAEFSMGPRAGRARIVTRVRLAGSQRVLAFAEMSDRSVWYGSAEVNVTESACLDGPA